MRTGTRLNHYEIVGRLGAGGMGEVYTARDTRLDRRIALKILPEKLAADRERRERFEREARAVAALNHANIVTIHSVEEAVLQGETAAAAGVGGSGTVHFLTMELVEGQPLSELIPGAGLSLGKFFAIAIPLTDAISAAHQKGIAHRDLKPANVMVTADGAVKLLDFGLAKLFEAPADRVDEMTTAQATAQTTVGPRGTPGGGPSGVGNAAHPPDDLTGEGKVLGTVAYMSPEQVEGRPIDHRADVFSLGIILYEMATGERPFEGDTRLSVMSSIVNDAPAPITELNAKLPRHLGRIIRRALEKDVGRRFQTALDLRTELEDLEGEIDSGALLVTGATMPAQVVQTRVRSLAMPIAIGVVAVAVLAAIWLVVDGGSPVPDGAPLRVSARRVAASPMYEWDPAISPDGHWFVYAMDGLGEPPPGVPEGDPAARPPSDIFLQSIDGQHPINLTSSPDAWESELAYSPDGDLIAFRRDALNDDDAKRLDGIWIMGRTGERPRRLLPRNSLPAWSPDGTRIYVSELGFADPRNLGGDSELRVIDVETEEERLLFSHDGWTAMGPSPSPNGMRVAFWGLVQGGQRDIWTMPADGGDPVAVTRDQALDWNPIWSPDGRHLFFSSDRGGSMNIWRIAIDEATGATLGEPEPLTSGGLADQGHLSISSDGKRILYNERHRRRRVERASFDLESATVQDDGRPLSSGPIQALSLNLSPDGQRAAYIDVRGQQDVWVMNVDGSGEQKVTDDVFKEWSPRWLEDNQTLYFYSDRGGSYDIWRTRADGSGLARVVAVPHDVQASVPSPDGRVVAIWSPGRAVTYLAEVGEDGGDAELRVLPPVPDRELPFRPSSWSRDGTLLAGWRGGLLLYSPETDEYTRLTDAGAYPVFTPDGNAILYWTNPPGPGVQYRLLDMATRESRPITVPHPTMSNLRLLPDGEHMLYLYGPPPEGDIWLLEIEQGR